MDRRSIRSVGDTVDRVDALSLGETIALAVLLGALVVMFDILTGPEISFSIFYVAPVALVSERLGRVAGWTAATTAAAAWYAADVVNDREYSQYIIPMWNGLVRLGFFAIIATMIVALRDIRRVHADEARVDPLTGMLNRRGFHERGAVELAHARRNDHPITVAYLDLDHFKAINDHDGHAAGDALLRRVAVLVGTELREGDVVGRLGGDEFALLLPDTTAETGRGVVERVCGALGSADRVIGCSAGVVTFRAPPSSIDVALELADQTMYRAKNEGRGTIVVAAG